MHCAGAAMSLLNPRYFEIRFGWSQRLRTLKERSYWSLVTKEGQEIFGSYVAADGLIYCRTMDLLNCIANTVEKMSVGEASERKNAFAEEGKEKKKRYFRNVAATGRSCNVEPESSVVPAVVTRTQELMPVGEVSEPKNTDAEAKGKWKRFLKKRHYKKIAATARSTNVIPKSSSVPDVATRTQETMPGGEASEQKTSPQQQPVGRTVRQHGPLSAGQSFSVIRYSRS